MYAKGWYLTNLVTYYIQETLTGRVRAKLTTRVTDENEYEGPQAVQKFFDHGEATFDSIVRTYANITEAVTGFTRANGAANFSEPVVGVAKEEKTCIAVRWPWLAFPTCLVLLTLAFFVVLVITTRPTDLRPAIWKSSPLALLYHGLSDHPVDPSGVSDAGSVRRGGPRSLGCS